MLQGADNQEKTLCLHDRKRIASGPPSESFKSTFGGKSLWILFHIELSFSLSTFFLLITSCIKHINVRPQVNLRRASKQFTFPIFFRWVGVGCTQAKLGTKLQKYVPKGEENRS